MSNRTFWLAVATVLTVAAVVGWMDGAQPPDASAHGDVNVQLRVQETGKCLSPSSNPPQPSQQVRQESCNSSARHLWRLTAYGNYHYFKNVANQALCLEVPNWQTGDGIVLETFWCNQTTAQLFYVPSCTSCWGEIRNVNSNKCVDLAGSGILDGTPIWQWPCHGVSYGARWWYFDTHGTENYNYDPARWYQRYWDSYNYTTWMTLSFDRQVLAGGSQYNGYVTSAVNYWNSPTSSTNTTYLAESSPYIENDIHLAVLPAGTNCYFGTWGMEVCLGAGVIGRTKSSTNTSTNARFRGRVQTPTRGPGRTGIAPRCSAIRCLNKRVSNSARAPGSIG